jgi:hypothetical protein
MTSRPCWDSGKLCVLGGGGGLACVLDGDLAGKMDGGLAAC